MSQGVNAGVRRNRRKAGETAVERRIYLSAEMAAALDDARVESGKLSLGLYLERLLDQLKTDQGSLPVIAPALLDAEVRHSDAA